MSGNFLRALFWESGFEGWETWLFIHIFSFSWAIKFLEEYLVVEIVCRAIGFGELSWNLIENDWISIYLRFLFVKWPSNSLPNFQSKKIKNVIVLKNLYSHFINNRPRLHYFQLKILKHEWPLVKGLYDDRILWFTCQYILYTYENQLSGAKSQILDLRTSHHHICSYFYERNLVEPNGGGMGWVHKVE